VIVGVADTHAALWYLYQNPRLSVAARTFMDGAAEAGHDIALSPISLADIVYLVERNRLVQSAYEDLETALSDPSYVIQESPLTTAVVDALRQVPRSDVPDMPTE
jgi:PIN domain nuclease of toxin-antitoxin system